MGNFAVMCLFLEAIGLFRVSIFCFVNISELHLFKNLSLSFKKSKILQGVPGGSEGRESACNAGDPDLIPGLGRSPGEANGNPLQNVHTVSLLVLYCYKLCSYVFPLILYIGNLCFLFIFS